ncbi:hypothetical protein CDD83_8652 [Cordyceps sp. RAO-2017]|nr:hypothetical protein CDD83_8652 [Cordyceps sp. RAO-2017]
MSEEAPLPLRSAASSSSATTAEDSKHAVCQLPRGPRRGPPRDPPPQGGSPASQTLQPLPIPSARGAGDPLHV